MIKVSVFYANTPGSHFDHGYYCKTHMPMVARLMGGHLKSYSVDKGIAGGAPVRLTNPLPGGVGVLAFRISADGQRVVYTVAQEIAGRIELY